MVEKMPPDPEFSGMDVVTQTIHYDSPSDENAARWRAVVEHSLDAVAFLDAHGVILSASLSTMRVLGYTSAEFVGRSANDLVHPDNRPLLAECLGESFRQPGVGISISARLLHKNGEWRWLEGMITNLLDEPGVHSFVNNYRDVTQRVETEHALRDSRARFAGIIDSAMDAIIGADAEQRIRLFNPAAEKMFGWSAGDVLGRPLALLIPPRFHTAHRQHIREFGETGVTTRAMGKFTPLSGMRKDQTEFPVEASISQNEVGGEKIYTVILRDISQRIQAEEQIQYQAGLIENVSDAIISTGAKLEINSWNRAAELLYGWRAAEVIGKPTEDILHTVFGVGERDAAHQILFETGRWSGEVVQKHRDGTELYVLSSTTALKDSRGNMAGIITVNRDSSQRRRAQQRAHFLEKAGETLASSLDFQKNLQTIAQLAVPQIADWCVIHLVDEQCLLETVAVSHAVPGQAEWSQNLQSQFALSRNPNSLTANVVRTGKTAFVPEFTDEMWTAAQLDPETLEYLRQMELYSMIIVPLIFQGWPLGAITLAASRGRARYTLEDVTVAEELARRVAIAVENARLYGEAKRLNEELEERVRERTKQLDVSNQELEAFSYSVSHDLRAPLRAIDGFSRILMRDAQSTLSPESLRYLTLVRENTRHMGQLVDDLLAFSRLSRHPIQRQTVDVGKLVQLAREELEVDQEGRAIDWQIGELETCVGDHTLLKQVWINLLSNALKYTRHRDTARIEIGKRITDTETIFYVQDNGVGFDMRYVHKLFGVFQRLHRAEEYEGTGVGLAIVHRVVSRHGGRVWAEAIVDQGATFYFTLGAD